MTTVAAPRTEPTVERYSFAERVLHWWTAITFILLMVSGFALGYPRMAFLSGLFGGGQTMRFLHPWIGLGFSAGVALMFFAWAKDMRFDATDRKWRRRLRTYARSGHTDLDVGKFNGGQKGYFWFTIILGGVLLLSGVPLWYPWLLSAGWNQAARLVHHAVFLLTVGGFIIHVMLSAVTLPGTMSSMASGKVTRAWAAWHHPRWFREQEEAGNT